MKILIIILLLSGCSSLPKGEFWTDDNTANGLMIAANVAFAADWAQTREIADNPDYYELGLASSFIGANPKTSDVNRYFAASVAGYNLVNYLLPSKYKKLYSSFVVGYELAYIKGNVRLGIGMKF